MQASSAHSLPPLLYTDLNPRRVGPWGAVLIVEEWVNVSGTQRPPSIQAYHDEDGKQPVISNAAIEFKIAHTEQQAVAAFTGVVEDVGGYKGSKDWTRFYAVMYQAKPFISKSQLDSDMKRIKAATWKAILWHGRTAPKVRRKFMAPASARRKKT